MLWTVLLEKILENPLTTRRSRQSILKEVNPDYSLEGLMLKLKLQYIGPLMQRASSLAKTLRLWKIEGRRKGQQSMRFGGWMASLTQWTWVWASSGRWWKTGKPGVLQSMALQRVKHDWVNEHQQHKPEIGMWFLRELQTYWPLHGYWMQVKKNVGDRCWMLVSDREWIRIIHQRPWFGVAQKVKTDHFN